MSEPSSGKVEGFSEERRAAGGEPAERTRARADVVFHEMAARGDLPALEGFLSRRAGRLRGHLRQRFGERLGGAAAREELVRAVVERAARDQDVISRGVESVGGVERWLWRLGVEEAQRRLRAPGAQEEPALAPLSLDDAHRLFLESPDEPAPRGSSIGGGDPTEELIRRAKENDPLAWEQIGERYRNVFKMLMRGRMPAAARRRYDTDDLIQSVLFRAFREIDTYEYRGEGSFGRWLTTMFRRRLTSKLREHGAERRDVFRDEPLDSWRVTAGGESCPEEQLAQAERLAAITLAFSELSEPLRQALAMKHWDGLSSAEIAAELDISERTVRRRIALAVEELQRILGSP